ncbi:hypothetical protein LPH37_08360, partial [Bifidobacterium longum subsp. longum]|uniref:hypothetical protein n=1 Tax=Bifidobacterium longum TaxID=216816 RepID=UPI001E38A64D
TPYRQRTDHRAMDGHDPKCATFRALPISAFPNDAYKRLVLLYQSEIDLNELERLLKTVAKVRIESGEQLDYDLRKDIRIYDFLKYGVDYLKNSTPPQSPSSAPTLSAEPNGSAGVSPTSDPNHA